jgi:hypothetical protein
MNQQLRDYLERAIAWLGDVPLEYVVATGAAILAWIVLRRVLTYLAIPAPLRDFALLRDDPETRLAMERRLFEIRAEEEAVYRRWKERQRQVRRTMQDLVSIADHAAHLQGSVASGDRDVDLAIGEAIERLLADLVASLAPSAAGRGGPRVA